MSYTGHYAHPEPTRAALEAGTGWQLLEFGVPWCPHCITAQPALKEWSRGQDIAHLKIEDGKGRPAGRAFTVKLWPTLILLRDGSEVARVVRPTALADLAALSAALTAS